MKKSIIALSIGLSTIIGAQSAFAASYEVKAGDTMFRIAKNNGTTLQAVVNANPQIANINVIYPKQIINIPDQVKTTVTTEGINLSQSEKDLLGRLVHAEAKGESFDGKVAVATVVLNRVKDASFPNTVEGVVYQSGQFSPVTNGAINNVPSADSIKAVDEAIRIVNAGQSDGSLYFYNPRTAINTSFLEARPTVKTIGNHTFKR